MSVPRRSVVEIIYEGKNISNDIAPYLTELKYTDNGGGQSDDLSLTLHDRDGKWRGAWLPQAGDKVAASIIILDWIKPGSESKMFCGSFEIDQFNYSGPPDVLQIGAVAFPLAAGLKATTKSKAWQKVTLEQIAARIAADAGLKLLYQTDTIHYDRIDQTEQTDIAFLSQLAEREYAMVKITDGTLVVFDDRRLETAKPVRTIERGKAYVKAYTFDRAVVGSNYAAATLTYIDDKKTISGTFRIPGSTGPTLKLNERIESQAEAIRKAKNALRQRLRDGNRARFTLVGDPKIVQGITVEVKGYGGFDGSYYVESATHSVGSGGYETDIDCRKVLTF